MNVRTLWGTALATSLAALVAMLSYDIQVPEQERLAWTSEMTASLVGAMFAVATAAAALAVAEHSQRRRTRRVLLADIDQTVAQLEKTLKASDDEVAVIELSNGTRIPMRANIPVPVGILEAAKSDDLPPSTHHDLFYAVAKMESLRTRIVLLLQVIGSKGEVVKHADVFESNLRSFFLDPIQTETVALRDLLLKIKTNLTS